MYITDKKIYDETKFFFKDKIINILLISVICSIITILINYFLSPNINQILSLKNNETFDSNSIFDRIKEMNLEQHKTILHIAIAGTTSSLIGNLLLISSILILIIFKISQKNLIFLKELKLFFFKFLKLFFLIIFITILVEFGFMMFIFPGIILIFILSLSPIILFIEKNGIFYSIINSIKLTLNNVKLIFPTITLWMLLKFFLIIFLSFLYNIMSTNIIFFLFNLLHYLFLSILIIYLTKLYILLKNIHL